MNSFYIKEGKLYASDYLEIHIPAFYFEKNKFATSKGASIETLGLVYLEKYTNGKAEPISLINLPAIINLMVYDSKMHDILIKNETFPVVTLKYLKDSYVMNSFIEKGREVTEKFLDVMLAGKLPKNLDYSKLIDIWWKNIEISGVSLQVPSKIFEIIIANVYRTKGDLRKRFAEYFGASTTSDPYNYQTASIRKIVQQLSTFSGLIFEDISAMISSGINNSRNKVIEKESPMEKLIYY